MRQQTFELAPGRPVTITEITLGEFRNLIDQTLTGKTSELGLREMLTTKFEQTIMTPLAKYITLSPGESLDDLTFSELKTVWQHFVKLNPFFRPIELIATVFSQLPPLELAQLIQQVPKTNLK
jgi:hypothetical protein